MPILPKPSDQALVQALQQFALQGHALVATTQLVQALQTSPATVKRMLERLLVAQQVVKAGKARATRYSLPAPTQSAVPAGPLWSADSLQLQQRLAVPLGAREPVTYQRSFVEAYRPNESALLPPACPQNWPSLAACRASSPQAPTPAKCWSRC